MRKLLLLASLLLTSFAFSQTPVTINGTVTDAGGNLASSGYVEFNLQPQNASMLYNISGSSAIAPQSVRCAIVTGGILANYTNHAQACLVWGNDIILPANSLYNVSLAPGNQVKSVIKNAYIFGSAVNIGGLTLVSPQPVIGTVIKGSPLVTESVVPDIPNTRQIGTAQNPYAAIYVQNCFLPNLQPCGGGGSTNFASPPPIGNTTPNTGVFTTIQGPIGTITQNSGQFTTGSYTSTGVFTNTQQNLYVQSLINGCNPTTEFGQIFTSQHGTEAFTGCLTIPASSTVFQANGIASYVNNQSGPTTAGVALFGGVRATVTNNGRIWGINTEAIDVPGIPSINIYGAEFDVNMNNVGTIATGTLCEALINVQPTDSRCLEIGKPQGLGGTAFWPEGIYFDIGATRAPGVGSGGAIVLNPLNTGLNQASQYLVFDSFDPTSGTNIASLNEDANGNLILTNFKGGLTGLIVPNLTVSGSCTGCSSFNAASPPAIGNTTPNTGQFTNLNVTGTCTGCGTGSVNGQTVGAPTAGLTATTLTHINATFNAQVMAGADLCAKINAALNACPTGGNAGCKIIVTPTVAGSIDVCSAGNSNFYNGVPGFVSEIELDGVLLQLKQPLITPTSAHLIHGSSSSQNFRTSGFIMDPTFTDPGNNCNFTSGVNGPFTTGAHKCLIIDGGTTNTQNAFGGKWRDLLFDCNNVANCIAFYTLNEQEDSGMYHVRIWGNAATTTNDSACAFWDHSVASSPNTGPSHFQVEDTYCDPYGDGVVGNNANNTIHGFVYEAHNSVQSSGGNIRFSGLTVRASGTSNLMQEGIWIDGSNQPDISNVHCEWMNNDCIVVGAGGNATTAAMIYSISDANHTANGVHFAHGSTGTAVSIQAQGPEVQDDTNSCTTGGSYLDFYTTMDGGQGWWNGSPHTCGSGNTDHVGALPFSVATLATFTFGGTYTVAPQCTVSPQFNTAVPIWATTTTTVLSIHSNAAITGSVTYHCDGRGN